MPAFARFPGFQTLVAILAAFAVHALLWQGSYAVFSASVDFNQGALEDFMGVYLPAAQALGAGADPVPGFLYAPFFAWILQPIAGLGPAAASWVWLGLQFTASLALLILGGRWVNRQVPGDAPIWCWPLYVFLGVLSFPLVHNLHWGQVSTLLTLLVVSAAGLQDRRWAGVCIGCAAAIKFYPALFLALLILSLDWRGLRWGVGAWAVLSLLPAFQVGLASLTSAYSAVAEDLASLSGLQGEWFAAPNNQSLAATATRWLELGTPGVTLWAVLGLVFALYCLKSCAPLMSEDGAPHRLLAFALVLLSLPLVLSPSWPHYFAGLPFVQLLLFRMSREHPGARACVGLSVLLSSTLLFRCFDHSERYGEWGVLLVADLLLIPVALQCATRLTCSQSDSLSDSSSSVA